MLTANQGTAGATAVKLCAVPAGPASLLLANLGTASPVYIGMGTQLTSDNGFPVPASVVPLVIPLYAGAQPQALYAVTASGAANLAWMITSPTGGTGTGTLG